LIPVVGAWLAIQEELPVEEIAPIAGWFWGVVLIAASWGLVNSIMGPIAAPYQPGANSHNPLGQKVKLDPLHIVFGVGIYLGWMVVLSVALVGHYGEDGLADMPPLVALLGTAGVHLGVVLTLVVFLWREGARRSDLGLTDPTPLRSFGKGVGLYGLCIPALFGAGLLWKLLMDSIGYTIEQQEVATEMQAVPMGQQFGGCEQEKGRNRVVGGVHTEGGPQAAGPLHDPARRERDHQQHAKRRSAM